MAAEDPLSQLPPVDRLRLERARQELADKIQSWRLFRRDPNSAKLEPSLQNLLLRAYDDIINAAVYTHVNPQAEGLEPSQRNYPQAGAAATAMEHVMNHAQMRAAYPNPEMRQFTAREIVGSVIRDAVTVTEEINIRLYMPVTLFR